MRIDVATAIVASLAIHGGFILLPGKPAPTPPVKPPVFKPDPVMVMPKLIEDDPLPVVEDKTEAPKEPLLIGPPRSEELYVTIDNPDIFRQPPQPPQPEGVKINEGSSIIPEHAGEHPGGKKPVTILNPNDLDQPPTARVQIKPVYPYDKRREGVSGTAMVSFIVDTEGNVQHAHAVSATLPEFGTAAVQAVSKWKFRPGLKNARPANTRMQIPIVFNIDEENR